MVLALFLSAMSASDARLLSSMKRMPSGSEDRFFLLSTTASISVLGATASDGRPAEQFERRLSGLFNKREGVWERECTEGVHARSDPVKLLCLDTGLLPALELAREGLEEFAGLTSVEILLISSFWRFKFKIVFARSSFLGLLSPPQLRKTLSLSFSLP